MRSRRNEMNQIQSKIRSDFQNYSVKFSLNYLYKEFYNVFRYIDMFFYIFQHVYRTKIFFLIPFAEICF